MTVKFLTIDQGTTSTRAVIFDEQANLLGMAQQDFPQHFPKSGWVEHDVEDIWNSTLKVMKDVLANTQLEASDIHAIGITNQRETTVVWDRNTGCALHKAIVWQDRRTARFCDDLKKAGLESIISKKTGLLLDPYFSASKLKWILDQVPGARAMALKGELAFGTIESFLLWRLTGGKVHQTDASNASRTLLYNIHQHCYDDELIELFDIPKQVLPEVVDNAQLFGHTEKSLFGHSIPITGMAGDQQSALIGQACFEMGSAKSTYGTGCFLVVNTGERAITSKHRLLTTLAYRFNGQCRYALEGSIFNAGTIVQWLRDQMGLFDHARDSETLARQSGYDTNGLYLIPAFTGLGAPYWRSDVRGAIVGINRDSTAQQLVSAGLLSVALQTHDLLAAIEQDGLKTQQLRVDGGMVSNDWFLQCLADLLDIPITRPKNIETTALGAAFLAGIGSGVYQNLDEISRLWKKDITLNSKLDSIHREKIITGWKHAIDNLLAQ